MKVTSVRAVLALVALISLASWACANEGGFGILAGRWWGQANGSSASGVRQVAYTAESGAGEEEFPGAYSDPFAGNPYYDGSCQNCPYDGCACQGCASGGCDCGGYPCHCNPCGCESNYCGGDYDMNAGMYYAEVQHMFMRAHVSEEVVGKLRERYEYSPRVVLGYESPSGLGGRVRYWNYTRTTDSLDPNDDALRFDFDVIDFEGTTRFSTSHAELVLAGGFRWADMKIVEDDDDEIDSEMPGITFAADVRGTICRGCNLQWAGVFGARWSMLGGDWEGDDSIIEPTMDDNIVTHDIYGGFELLCHRCGYDLYARIVFEMQNWRSDALGEETGVDSFGFVGPAVHTGITF